MSTMNKVIIKKVVKKNANMLKSLLATIVIMCYVFSCVKIVYFIYYYIYKLYQII